MCDEIVVHVNGCVLRNKMSCTMKLDYSQEEVRSGNLAPSFSPNCTQRQDTRQDVWVWMQWVTVTSLVPCHAMHVPQHVAVSLSEPSNQMISSAPSTETVFTVWTRHIRKQTGFKKGLLMRVHYPKLRNIVHTISL